MLQIGELIQNGLSKETIQQIDVIPWRQIYALRNRIVHGYASVDYQIIWETITEDIPKLGEELEDILK